MSALSPFVFWAQNETNIYLKVDLKDVKDAKIQLSADRLEFGARGVGARGLNDYAFTIDFNAPIDTKKSTHKITDNRVDFNIVKTENAWWPRLVPIKPFWLKIDHDRFQSEDIQDDEEEEEQQQQPNIMNDYKNLYEKLQKEEIGYKKEDFQKVYLTVYNLIMYVGFMYIVCVLSVRYLKEGTESFSGTYGAVGPAMCFLTLLQLLEVLHPIFGYVKGGYLIPLLQIGGKLLVVIFMIDYEPRIQTMPVTFYLFMAWSAAEIVRYPFYMSQILRKEHGLLTWLRHTIWIFLYPLGFMCEGVVIFRNIIFLDQENRWSIDISWPFEFTFRVSQLLRIYLLFFMIPVGYVLMSHMYKKRKFKLGPHPIRKSKKVK